MKKIFFLFSIAMITFACNNTIPEAGETREMFDAGGLHVITSFANRKQQTMSVLYGNEAARQSALSEYTHHFPGEVFKLAVFRQASNKYWYGSYINGKLLSVETVAGNAGRLSYKLEKGLAPVNSKGEKMSEDERLAFIFSHKASVFP